MGGRCPADRRHCGMLNHLCSALPEQWVCLPDCVSRLQPGSFPVQRPSTAPSVYPSSEQRGVRGACSILSEAEQPLLAAFYRYHRSSRGGLSFGCAVGQNGKPSAFSCENNILHQKNRKNEAREQGEGCDRRWGYYVVLKNNPVWKCASKKQYHNDRQSRQRQTA